MKQQLLFIHGGESFTSAQDYRAFLESFEEHDPFDTSESRKWKYTLPEALGSTWECAFPRMPNAVTNDYSLGAHYLEWEIWFNKMKHTFRENIVCIGHSLGANFLAKYLQENTLPVRVSQLHLVAGVYGEGDFTLPETLEQVRAQCDTIYIYHSKDDEVVPFSDAEQFMTALSADELVVFEDRGHFLQETFPEIIERIRA